MLITIYQITCDLDSSLFYIGSTQNTIQYRFQQHYRSADAGSMTRFHRNMREQGLNNWTIEEIHSQEVADRSEGYEVEYTFIKELKPSLNVIKSNNHSAAIDEYIRKKHHTEAADYIRKDVHRYTCCCGFFSGNPEVFLVHQKKKGWRRHRRVEWYNEDEE